MQSSFLIILLEVIGVLLISRIRVPGFWADRFITAFSGSIPAMAVIGLIAWLFFFKLFGGLLVYIEPDAPTNFAERLNSTALGLAVINTIGFIDKHPFCALAFGPVVTLILLVQGSWSSSEDRIKLDG